MMKRGTSFCLSLFLVLLATSIPAYAQRVFVHVFDLNIGGVRSTTDFVVYLPETTGTAGTFLGIYTVRCFDENGLESFIIRDIMPGQTLVINIQEALPGNPEMFNGTCIVGGENIAPTSIWNLQVPIPATVLGSGSGVNISRVGQHSYDRSEASMDWALAIGEIPGGSTVAGTTALSNVGVAIHNTEEEVVDCTTKAVDGSGTAVAGFGEDQREIPGLGKKAFFPFSAQALAGQTISIRVTCDQPVFVIAVIQDAANGFPTPSFGFPLP